MDKITHEIHRIFHKLDQLHCLGEQIMSKLKDFADAQNAFNDRMDVAIVDLQDDIKNLNDQIKKLQQSPGEMTPEDQAMLDALQERSKVISDKLDALNALTPPAPPVG